MRKQIMISALVAATASMPAMADDEYFDNARVLSVTPQTERVNTPRQECRTEYIREGYSNNDRSPAGAIIGGIAGGLLGSQIGKGNGRVAGAAVGAGLGAIVGDRVDNSPSTRYGTRPVDRCVTVDNWQTISRGYLVSYRYNGRDYTTVTDQDPGDSIRVRINVSADGNISQSSYDDPVYIGRADPAPVYNIRGDWDRGRWDRRGHGNRGYW